MECREISLIAGHPALDFVNTVENRGTETEWDYLYDHAELTSWSAHAGLISGSRCDQLLRHAKQHPMAATRAWREAMVLREHLNRIFDALANSDAPPRSAVVAFNRILDQAFANRRLLPSKTGDMRWTWKSTGSKLRTLVWEIALAAAELMTHPDHHRKIKICANDDCNWKFLLVSQRGHRRWCEMATCGNISKVRRFRDRQRALE